MNIIKKSEYKFLTGQFPLGCSAGLSSSCNTVKLGLLLLL